MTNSSWGASPASAHRGFAAALMAVALILPASLWVASTPQAAHAAPNVIVAGCEIVLEPTPTEYTDCPGWDATGLVYPYFAEAPDVDWSYANLAGASFTGQVLNQATNATITGANFSGASLGYNSLAGFTVTNSDFTNVTSISTLLPNGHASYVDFSGATLNGAFSGPASMDHVTFDGATLGGGFQAVTVSDSSFDNTTWTNAGVPFVQSTMTDVSFTDAIFTDTSPFIQASVNRLDFTGSSVTNSYSGTAFSYQTATDLILENATFVRTALQDLNINAASGVNARGLTIEGNPILSGTWQNADLTGANLDAHAGGWNIPFATIAGAYMPGYMAGSDLRGLDFSSAVSPLRSKSDFRGSNLDGSDWHDITVYGMTLEGASAVGADFSGMQMLALTPTNPNCTAWSYPPCDTVLMNGADLHETDFSDVYVGDGVFFSMNGTRVPGVSFVGFTLAPNAQWMANGVDFNSADLHGVDMSAPFEDGDYSSSPVEMYGSIFAYADLTGATVRLSGGGYYGNAEMSDTTLFGAAAGAYFHDTNLENAVIVGYWPDGTWSSDLRGAEFIDANLAGANLINTNMEGTVLTRADLTGASIQSNWWVNGIRGLNAFDADLSDANLPKPSWTESGSTWMYGLYFEGTDVSGTGLLWDEDFTAFTVSPDGNPTAIDWDLPTLWDNPYDKLPFGDTYDDLFWHGASLVCDHEPGDTLPVGTTTVTCQVRFDHRYGLTDPIPWDTSAFISGSWPAVSGMGTPELPAIAPMQPWDGSDASQFTNQGGWMGTSEGIYTLTDPISFEVTVGTVPELSGTLDNGTETVPYVDYLTVDGVPEPAVTLISGDLPAGLTLDSDGRVHGTPEVGTAGSYPLTFRATNEAGSVDYSTTLVIDRLPSVSWEFDNGIELVAYDDCLAVGGEPAPTVTLLGGDLPAGLTLGADGCLTGTPELGTQGSYPLTLRATNEAGSFDYDTTLVIDSAPALSGSLDNGAETVEYSSCLTVDGVPVPTVSLLAGDLPLGLELDFTGCVYGTPEVGTAGSYPLTFEASSDAGTFEYETILVIDRLPGLAGDLDNGTELVEYEDCLLVTGQPTPVVTLTAGDLPRGLTLDSDGCVRGTPEAGTAGSYPLTFTATSDAGTFDYETTLVIEPAPAPTASPTGGTLTGLLAAGLVLLSAFAIAAAWLLRRRTFA